jgi:hypothetical protein
MPAILPRDAWQAWLGETDASLTDVKALLQTYEDGGSWTMEPQQRNLLGRRGSLGKSRR